MRTTSRTSRTIRALAVGFCLCVVAGLVLQMEHRRPVMELERAGAAVVADVNGNVRTVSFCSPQATDAHLRLIAQMPMLTSLNLARSSITADGVRTLGGLKKLEMLDLSETPRGAGLLEVVAQFPALRTLQLRRCPWLTDAELSALVRMPALESLMISDADITDAGLETLARCPQLTQLGVDRCPLITDSGIRRLAALGQVENVSINECPQLTDNSVEALAMSGSVKAISACGIPMTRSALQTVTQVEPSIGLTLDRFDIPEWQPLLDAGARIGLDDAYQLRWVELDDRWDDPAAMPPYSLSVEPVQDSDSLIAELDHRRVDVTDELLHCLQSVPELPRLYLKNLPITDAQLARLCRLPQLELLSLEHVPITDDGLRAVAGYESLQSLRLLRVPVTGEGLAALTGLPNLKELVLLSDCVSQSGLEAVARLRQLESLALGDVSSLSLAQGLGELPNLSQLALVRATLTANDIERLCSSPRLVEIELAQANLLGDAFAPLAEMSALQVIYLGRCEFDRAALQRLIDGRPDLQIYGAAELSRGSPRAASIQERGRLLGGMPLMVPLQPTR